MSTAQTFKSAQAAMAHNDEVIYSAIYVFDARYQDDATVEGFNAIEVVYAERAAANVKYARRNRAVVMRLMGCGVNLVPCIFV